MLATNHPAGGVPRHRDTDPRRPSFRWSRLPRHRVPGRARRFVRGGRELTYLSCTLVLVGVALMAVGLLV